MLNIQADYDYFVRMTDAVETAGSNSEINGEGFLVTLSPLY